MHTKTQGDIVKIISSDSPEAQTTIVFFNDEIIQTYIMAQEGDEGWIEIYDLNSIAALDLTIDPEKEEDEAFSEIRPRRKIGKVEFKKL